MWISLFQPCWWISKPSSGGVIVISQVMFKKRLVSWSLSVLRCVDSARLGKHVCRAISRLTEDSMGGPWSALHSSLAGQNRIISLLQSPFPTDQSLPRQLGPNFGSNSVTVRFPEWDPCTLRHPSCSLHEAWPGLRLPQCRSAVACSAAEDMSKQKERGFTGGPWKLHRFTISSHS